MNSTHLLDWVQDRLGKHLIELHRIRRSRRVSVAGLRRAIDDVVHGSSQAARASNNERVAEVEEIISQMKSFLTAHGTDFRVELSLIHNDLWWDNIIVAKDDIYLIDFEWMRTGDYVEDLAYFHVMLEFRPLSNAKRGFWKTSADELAANRFIAGILDQHAHEFGDKTSMLRMQFYLALITLRRLSDYAAGFYGDQPALRDHWLSQLSVYWRSGLVLSDPINYDSSADGL